MSKDLLTGLTEEQKDVVLHTTGPLLVVAGAGTGKTRVLTTRIAQLVSTSVKPENILALTFTEKAASEMSERVDELLPLGTNTATITTFHSFTTDILRTYAHLLGIPSDFSLLTQEEEMVLLRENIFNLPLKILRPGSNPTKFLYVLQSFYNRLKDEAISPEELLTTAKKYQQNPDKAKQDSGKILHELAVSYAAYEKILLENGYLTFGHCITETIKLINQHPSVLHSIRQQYQYVLVDEYQDTNWAQTELAASIAGPEGNIMVVGDDDQAIYSFRGASTSNLIDFKKRYPKCKQVVLTSNFRSTQNILDAAYRMIQQNNPDRLEYQHKINKRLKSNRQGVEPELALYDRLSSELVGITKKIQDWLEQDIAPQDIAVLTRTRSHAAVITQALQNAGINVNSSLGTSITEYPLVKGLLAFLQLLVNSQDNIAFFNVLANPPINIDPATLNRLISSRPYKEDTYYNYVADQIINPDSKPYWMNDKELAKLVKLYKWHQSLSETVGMRPSVALLRTLHETGLYKKLTSKKTISNETDLERLGEIFELMQSYEERHLKTNTQEFLNYLDIVTDNGQDASANLDEADPFSVNVMTIHQSKGLEFNAVVVPHCVNGRFPSRKQTDPFELPAELIKESISSGDVHLEEERRLFYVAITRAKEKLLITAAQRYGGTKRESKLAPFVLEVFGEGALAAKLNSSHPSEYLQTTLELPELAPKIKKTAERITISHTNLSTYIDCPWKYRYQAILKIRVFPGAAMTFGISIHNALRSYFDHLARGQKVSLSYLLDKYWISGSYESRSQEKERKQEGVEALQNIETELGAIKPKLLEWSFNVPLETGDRLRGRIDRVDELDNKLNIVDYKTGAAKTAAQAKKDLQLGIYILAAEKTLNEPVASVTLHYVMSDEKVTIKREEFELNSIREKITSAINNLKEDLNNDNFEAKPDMFTCQYCDYNKICPFRYTK